MDVLPGAILETEVRSSKISLSVISPLRKSSALNSEKSWSDDPPVNVNAGSSSRSPERELELEHNDAVISP